MHEDCARYALANCPFLKNSKQKYHVKAPDNTCPIETVRTQRSDTVCLLRTKGFKVVDYRQRKFIFANRWDHVEHWHDGERVPDPPGWSTLDLLNRNGVLDSNISAAWFDEMR